MIVSLLFLGGMQMVSLGVFGEDLWRILGQVPNRPPFVVEKRYPRKDKAGRPSP